MTAMPQWKVTGPRAFMGVAPGETFYADISPEQAQRALDRGSIELVGKGMPKLNRARVSPPASEAEESAEAESPLIAPEPETEDQ